MSKWFLSLVFFCFVGLVALPGCAASEDASVASSEEALRLNQVLRLELDLPTRGGLIHARLAFTLAGLARRDRDLIVLVPGTLANGAGYYDVLPGSGYNALEILARERYVVVAPDLRGTGENRRLADGSNVDTESIARTISDVAHASMRLFHASDSYVYGETGVGTNVCLLVAREDWVRGIVIASPFYLQFGPAGAAQLFDPGWAAFLQSFPDGYLPLTPETFAPFYYAADPEVAAAATTATLGPAPQNVPTGPLLELYEHIGPDSQLTGRLASPIVDAALADAPALFIQGDPDPLGSVEGAEEMDDAYGGDSTLIVISGATHLMRFDSVISDGPESEFWEPILDFLDTH